MTLEGAALRIIHSQKGIFLDQYRALTTNACSPGLRGSLSRLQLDYVDIVFANRNDVNSPMEGDELQNIYTM